MKIIPKHYTDIAPIHFMIVFTVLHGYYTKEYHDTLRYLIAFLILLSFGVIYDKLLNPPGKK